GSVLDTAKAIIYSMAAGKPLEQLMGDEECKPSQREVKLPLLAVPMTASGAEVTPAFGIRGLDGRKHIFRDAGVVSSVVLLDPSANLAVPAGIMLSSGMNGLAHCIEAAYATNRSPISTALATYGMTLFMQGLPRVA